ncbi:MAG: rRNA pseudouridine synthase [Bacteroidales bacterium]|nr:rRNA pseudouridine synthase [Bacteroidales bacterium]
MNTRNNSNRSGKGADKRKPNLRQNRKKGPTRSQKPEKPDDGLIRLNKFIADSGVCSRREADRLIETGAIKVNGKVVTQVGTKVSPTDKVQYDGETLNREKPQYVLLNKPKGYITTMDDPRDRKTVVELIKRACKERVYPVGRLDRNTTGVLLFTNDGELAKRLSHPKYNVHKVYQVTLDQALTKSDMNKIADGLTLEDGPVKVDAIAYAEDSSDKRVIGIELHSGKNRIVRRIFESLEYKIVKLDRVSFAGLTKKEVPRGKWRHLTEKEISMLKMRGNV